MPRKLKDLREVTPKDSLQNIQDDPARNSVLGNVKKLYDALEEYNDDFTARDLRERLGTILDGFEGKVPEEKVDNIINRSLHASLSTFYMEKNGINKIQDEEKRKKLNGLMEYVAAGLDVDRISENYEKDINTTEAQKANIKAMEDRGRIEVAKEKEEAERQAEKAALEAKSGLNVLDEHKAAINGLPKTFRGKNAVIDESVARQTLKGLCIDILATRRSIGAKRNDKAGLAKAKMDADLLAEYKKEMVKSNALNDFFDSMSYKDLRSLAYDGHGGKMEEKFSEYLRKAKTIPEDAPACYMPTALEHADALKAQMKDPVFQKRTTMGDQRIVYRELLATRAAVASKRGDKNSLRRPLDAKTLASEREKLKKEPLATALVRMTTMGDRQEITSSVATDGHGGALEDFLRDELRLMASEKDNGYRMQDVDERYAPTYKERKEDLKRILRSGSLSTDEMFRAAVELGKVDAAQSAASRGEADRINNINSINNTTDEAVAFYSKLMGKQDKMQFVNDVYMKGYDEACKTFDAKYPGEVKAARLSDQLEEKLNGKPSEDDLKKLAAQKMVLAKHKGDLANGKITSSQLENALETKKFEADVNKLMKEDHLFNEVCEKLGERGLAEQAKGDGLKLFDSYNLAKEDKLEFYNPNKPVVKEGPVNAPKKQEQEKGPQMGGPGA